MMKLQKNRKLKRLIAVFLLMALLFTACGEKADESETVPEKTESEALTEPASETAPESESESETEEIRVELPDYMPLEELVKEHRGYSPEEAREDGCIVCSDAPTEYRDLMLRFLELASEGEEATIRFYSPSIDSAPVIFDVAAKTDGTYEVTQSVGYMMWNGETLTRKYTHMQVIRGSDPWDRYTRLYLTNHSDLRALDLEDLAFAAEGYYGYDVFGVATSAEKWDERIDPYLLKGEAEGFDFRMLLCDGTELTFASDSPVFTWDGKEYDVSENADRLLSAADLEAEGRIFLVGEKDGIYYACHWEPGSAEFAWEKTWEKQS